LRRDSRRLLSLFEEARLIDHQDARCFPQMVQDVGAQLLTHCLLIPVSLGQQPLHPVRAALAQRLGELPTILALHWCQQAFQEPAHPPAHLGTPKARANPLLHLVERLRGVVKQLKFAGIQGVVLLCCGHLPLLSAAAYHVSFLSGTVVLVRVWEWRK
jgi:hypothetical protein